MHRCRPLRLRSWNSSIGGLFTLLHLAATLSIYVLRRSTTSTVLRSSPRRHPFLSDGWFDAVEAFRSLLPEVPDEFQNSVVNVSVTGGPHGPVEFHLAGGAPARGRHAGAPTTIELPYKTARSMLIDGNPKDAAKAFMTGKLLVKGDLTALVGLQSLVPDLDSLAAEHGSLIAQLKAITVEDEV